MIDFSRVRCFSGKRAFDFVVDRLSGSSDAPYMTILYENLIEDVIITSVQRMAKHRFNRADLLAYMETIIGRIDDDLKALEAGNSPTALPPDDVTNSLRRSRFNFTRLGSISAVELRDIVRTYTDLKTATEDQFLAVDFIMVRGAACAAYRRLKNNSDHPYIDKLRERCLDYINHLCPYQDAHGKSTAPATEKI
ncbi:MAG: hypothetical protein WCF45_10465 [Photobacterium halotolerans]